MNYKENYNSLMDPAVYIISVKNTKDEWLSKKEVHYYSTLFKTLQQRLGDCKILSSPICECLQFAALMTTPNNTNIFIVEELFFNENPQFLLGVPSSMQQSVLNTLKVPDFSQINDFPVILNHINSINSNAVIVVSDDSRVVFEKYSETRKDLSKIGIFRVRSIKSSEKCTISKCFYKKNRWILEIKNISNEVIKNSSLVLKESNQTLTQIREIPLALNIRVHLNESLDDNAEIQTGKNEKLLIIYSKNNFDMYGKHICIFLQNTEISNAFYIPEFEINVAKVENEWFCRIKNHSNIDYGSVDLFAEDFFTSLNIESIPKNQFLLIRIFENLIQNPSFVIKFKGKTISNVAHFVYDTIDL